MIDASPESSIDGTSIDRHAARIALAAALFGLLFAVYLLSFSGAFSVDDERFLFDTTESIAKRGDLILNQTTNLRSLRRSDAEPGQPLLAVPLYLLASQLNFVGNVQTTFLFNPLVTALTGVVLFCFGLQLGYRQRDALLAALLFGVGTIAWPYTRTFFREPLATLSLLASFMFARRWREGFGDGLERRQFGWLLATVVAYAVSALTKEAALVAAPLLAVYAVPPLEKVRTNKRGLIILIGGALAVIALLVAIILLLKVGGSALSSRYNIFAGLGIVFGGLKNAGEGIRGLLVSPGRSVFVYSPIVLLAIGSLFIREPGSRRERWLAIAMLLIFTIFYAAGRPTVWFGGANWGPRFLVPVTPFLVLASMPLLKRGLDAEARWPGIGLGLLALLSVAVQVGGSFISFRQYLRDVRLANAIWQLRYSPALGHLRLLGSVQWDVSWARPAVDGLTLGLLLAIIVASGGLLIRLARHPVKKRTAWLAVSGSLMLMLIAAGVTLLRAYDDPKYSGGNADLHALVNYLEETAAAEEPILLGNDAYINFFANYYKADGIWYTMPHSPGERHSEEQVPAVISDDPEELTHRRSKELISSVDGQHPFWLVEDSGPFIPWNPRPPEWWAAEHYYTVRSEEFSPVVRAIRYLSFPSPENGSPPARQVDAHFGDDILLSGYDLSGLQRPDAMSFRPGDELGLSLVWTAEAPPAEDYIVAVFIFARDGQLVVQMDRTPVATFRPTTSWQAGETVRDNYGFILPDDLSPGEYQILTTMYRWPSQARLSITTADGDNVGDLLTLTSFELVDEDAALD